MGKGKLYLIPTTLGDTPVDLVIPQTVKHIVHELKEFIVEKEKTARRFLKKMEIPTPQQELIFHTLNKHTPDESFSFFLSTAENGGNIGLLSEAGLPAVADPGAQIVKLAHQKGIKIIPLTGPSSIFLALMASGLNGQNFTFHGYLPRESGLRVKKLKELEKTAQKTGQTQIFIETPYRNHHLLGALLSSCSPKTLLCIGADITLPSEFIKTKSIDQWKKQKPDIHKKPAVFLIGS